MNTLLLLILIVLLALSGAFAYVFYRLWRIAKRFQAFILPVDEKTGSEFAQVCGAIADMFGRSITAQIKTTFMGKASGVVRGENAVEADIVQDQLGQQAGILGLLSQFPALQKTLRRNPALVDFAMSKIAGLSKPGNQAQTRDNGQVKFKL